MASRTVDYLDSLPPEIEKISNQKIAKEIGCSKTNSRTWGDAVFKASNDQFEWEKPKGAQSFYRGSELIKYKEQNKTLTLHTLADETLLH